MNKQFLKFNNVSYTYENSIAEILLNVSFQITNGWTGIIGANGAGKTTLLKLACGLFDCSSGSIEAPPNCYYNEQRTDFAPRDFSKLLSSYDNRAFRLIDELKIEHDWIDRWDSLSHGERKRVQLACALWNLPDLLAVDEPTNHLDQEAKDMIVNSLQKYNGIGIIVSHDRNLLEDLCKQFLFIESSEVEIRRGRLSEIFDQRKTENVSALKQLELKKLEIEKYERELKRRSDIVEKAKKKSSKRNIDKKDRDAKAKIDLGRLTGKDAVGGKQKTQMKDRIDTVRREMQNIQVKREYNTGIVLSGSYSKRNFILNLEPGSLVLNADKTLQFINMIISPRDKISLTGRNGSGKSTFLRYILKHLNVEPEHVTYIPQEVSAEETKRLKEEINKLPKDQLGKLMIIISRLGSDAKRLLDTGIPSPGETRKLLLGLGITKDPHIIIMDEPTNHMDLISIQCLEDALQNVSCALLLVSHDKKFLEALTETKWQITESADCFDLTTL